MYLFNSNSSNTIIYYGRALYLLNHYIYEKKKIYIYVQKEIWNDTDAFNRAQKVTFMKMCERFREILILKIYL